MKRKSFNIFLGIVIVILFVRAYNITHNKVIENERETQGVTSDLSVNHNNPTGTEQDYFPVAGTNIAVTGTTISVVDGPSFSGTVTSDTIHFSDLYVDDIDIIAVDNSIGYSDSGDDWVIYDSTDDLGTTYNAATELYFNGGGDDGGIMIDLETWEITIDSSINMDAASLMFIRGVQYYAEDRILYLERILDKKGIEYDE